MGKAICLITGNHLCHNPRALKEAEALTRAGHDVTVLGGWTSAELKQRDQALLQGARFAYIAAADFTGLGESARLRRIGGRLRTKAADVLARSLSIESPHQLGWLAGPVAMAARRTKADLYIAHSEAGLLAARDLLGDGRKVGVDMEDWFSKDLLPEARVNRPIHLLEECERAVLGAACHATSPSAAMSEALASAYGCVPPRVVYNAFPWAERKTIDGRYLDRRDRMRPSIHWFSQTLGPGRGVEELIAALPSLDKREIEIHLRGRLAPGFGQWLERSVPAVWRSGLFLHDLVPNGDLLSRIAEHDIGFAGEQAEPPSRNLTVTNKMLQYLQGGLAVLASDTSGQKEVAGLAPGALTLYRSGDPADLARSLNALLANPERLAAGRRAALRAAEAIFSWERCESLLLESVDAALTGRRLLA